MALGWLGGEVLDAIRRHIGRVHHRGITVGEIVRARRGRPGAGVLVVVTPGAPGTSAWFSCLLCPVGARRFRSDVGWSACRRPPAWHLEAIREHFRAEHGIERLSARRVYSQPSSAGRALATYVPATPLTGPVLLCALCGPGLRIMLEEPPYGDARSFWHLRARRPELRRDLTGLDEVERAERLEAHHRGVVIPRATQPTVKRALSAARNPEPPPPAAGESGLWDRDTRLEAGLRGLLLTRVAAGTRITATIRELVALMGEDMDGYCRALAGHTPDLEWIRGAPPGQAQEMLEANVGAAHRSGRALWSVWGRIPKPDHDEAVAVGQTARDAGRAAPPRRFH